MVSSVRQSFASVNAAHDTSRAQGHSIHPDRKSRINQTAPPPTGHTSGARNQHTCPLCEKTGHGTNVWKCPNMCARCAQSHLSDDCPYMGRLEDLWCSHCTRTGHVARVCLKRHTGMPPGWQMKTRPSGNYKKRRRDHGTTNHSRPPSRHKPTTNHK